MSSSLSSTQSSKAKALSGAEIQKTVNTVLDSMVTMTKDERTKVAIRELKTRWEALHNFQATMIGVLQNPPVTYTPSFMTLDSYSSVGRGDQSGHFPETLCRKGIRLCAKKRGVADGQMVDVETLLASSDRAIKEKFAFLTIDLSLLMPNCITLAPGVLAQAFVYTTLAGELTRNICDLMSENRTSLAKEFTVVHRLLETRARALCMVAETLHPLGNSKTERHEEVLASLMKWAKSETSQTITLPDHLLGTYATSLEFLIRLLPEAKGMNQAGREDLRQNVQSILERKTAERPEIQVPDLLKSQPPQE